ncbi:MAG TPA: hypothetical protein VGG04_13835 [Candidatus Sulfotelmatobacter sp.]
MSTHGLRHGLHSFAALRLRRFYNRRAGVLSHDHSRSGKPIAICTACARLWLERHG